MATLFLTLLQFSNQYKNYKLVDKDISQGVYLHMTKIYIFEGIATSGKSSVIELMKSETGSTKLLIVLGEEQTHIPIMQLKSELHLDFFKNVLISALSKKPDILLIDRLYLTQAYRSGATLKNYESIETFLQLYDAKTVFLKIDEGKILSRILKAVEHRDSKWGDYIKTRGQSSAKVAAYYLNQQRSLIDLLVGSIIPFEIINATDNDYEEIVSKLIKR